MKLRATPKLRLWLRSLPKLAPNHAAAQARPVHHMHDHDDGYGSSGGHRSPNDSPIQNLHRVKQVAIPFGRGDAGAMYRGSVHEREQRVCVHDSHGAATRLLNSATRKQACPQWRRPFSLPRWYTSPEGPAHALLTMGSGIGEWHSNGTAPSRPFKLPVWYLRMWGWGELRSCPVHRQSLRQPHPS